MTGPHLSNGFWNNNVCFGAPWVLNFCLWMTTLPDPHHFETLYAEYFNRRLSPVSLASILSGLKSIERVWDIAADELRPSTPPTCLPELRRAFADEMVMSSPDQMIFDAQHA
ncbi:hypothetical protein AVEN_160250-1 [Araneus ventricosus]|uniref:Uncharacterized protein n=1 Tax=Araneus ventricosus TaxID=182803 RepID=A0A4Y2UDA3_ARAVE|nr:hypothetical protein AVEN_160250-1 [Araneus ventricosus]